MFQLENDIKWDFWAHAKRAYPDECVGFVIDGKYRPQENIHENPREGFKVSPDDYVWALKLGDLECVMHSHPDGPNTPTAADMESQMSAGVPYGIGVIGQHENLKDLFFWGEHTLDEPLNKRDFRHGVYDCYSAVRAWYWQDRGLKLGDMPRDMDWWLMGHDMYQEGFKKNGFRRLGSEEPLRRGDGFLMQIRSQVPNHAGILVANDLIFHHLYNRLSREEPLGRWRNNINFWIRHESYDAEEPVVQEIRDEDSLLARLT